MAEPIGFAASLATLGGAADVIIRVARTFVQAACDNGEIEAELKFFAATLRTTGDSFKVTLMILEKFDNQIEYSEIFHFLSSGNTLKDIQENIVYLKKGMKKVPPLLANLTSKYTILAKLRWLLTQKTILTELVRKMKWVESTVGIIMYAVHIERNRLDASRTQDQSTLLRLKDDR